MEKKKSFSIISFLSAILAVIFLAGCGTSSPSDPDTGNKGTNGAVKDGQEAETPIKDSKTFTSTDGVIELTAPENWEEIEDLNSAANIQIGDLTLEQYTITITENAADFADSFGLREYYDAIIPPMQQNITNAEVSDIKEIKIGGNDAIQFHLSGEVNSIKVTYLITVIKSEDYFHQIISWTLQSMYSDYEDLYKSIADSLTEK